MHPQYRGRKIRTARRRSGRRSPEMAASLPANPSMQASTMVQVSSITAHLSTHAAARINEAMCGSRPSGENAMDSAGIAETTSRLSKSISISMSPIRQESEGCAALDGPATASPGTPRIPPPPAAVSGIRISKYHLVEPCELTASDRPRENPCNRCRQGSVPGHIRYERPLPRHEPVLLASSSPSTRLQLLHHLPWTEARNSGGRSTAKSLARTHPDHEAHSKAEEERGAFTGGF